MVSAVETEKRVRVITPPQHMTQACIGGLDRQIDQAMVSKPEAVGVELGSLASIDSACLNWLLAAQNRLAAQGIQMLVRNPSELCLDIFMATRLDHRFKIVGAGMEGTNHA